MRERDHEFKVIYISGKDSAHRPAIVDAGDLLGTTAATESPTFFWWQVGVVTVDQVDIAHRSIPIDVASIVRLIIGAPFQ